VQPFGEEEDMLPSGSRRWVALLLVLGFLLGCAVPSPASPPLSAAAAQSALDGWNPSYCKVVKFYGFYLPAESPHTQVAYVLLANPGDRHQKPAVYEARFLLLNPPEGQPRWFLVSLITHSQGLTRRQGWDNLMVEVKEAAPAASQ
jgi:hypothetical protein